MRKIYLLLLLGLFLIQPILAVDLTVEKLSEKEVMIVGLEGPAVFEVNVTNNELTDKFLFYTFFGLGMEPTERIEIGSNESKAIELKVFPREDSDLKGYVTFSYFIQGLNRSEIEEKLILNIVNLEDGFEIGAGSINPESNSINIYLHNKLNFNFEKLKVSFSSPFFNFEEVVDFSPYERKDFEIVLNKEDFSKLMAGFYTLKASLEIENVTATIEESINFLEKNMLRKERRDYGFIISTTVIKEINEGNTLEESRISINKNILSRMFTTFSPEPSFVERDGSSITYTWSKKIGPGEYSEVEIKTNWLIPLLILIIIILTIIMAKKYSKTDLVLRKRVSFVRVKGGEFALKVMIGIEAKKFVENVRIFDRLPPLVKVYDRYGGELPKRFNKTKRTFEWDLGTLEATERRMLSYMIYSKIGVLGKFALPATISLFEREGKTKEVSSNKAFFLSDQRSD